MPDARDALAIVRDDVVFALGEVLPPDDENGGFAVLEGFETTEEFPLGDFRFDDGGREATVVAVPWQWTGIHLGEILGVRPTEQRLTIRGVTLLKDGEEGMQLHRYVDWFATLQDLGVRLYDRPVVDVLQRFAGAHLEIDEFSSAIDESRR